MNGNSCRLSEMALGPLANVTSCGVCTRWGVFCVMRMPARTTQHSAWDDGLLTVFSHPRRRKTGSAVSVLRVHDWVERRTTAAHSRARSHTDEMRLAGDGILCGERVKAATGRRL